MAGTIQLGGLASGLDTQSIVQQLVGASSGHLTQLQQHASQLRAGAATFSDISKSLSALSTAASALANVKDTATYSASSSSSAIDVVANGNAQAGSYDINVTQLASEQRTYSSTFNSNTTALSQTGTFTVQIGTKSATISVGATDTLQDVAAKINNAGMRVTSSVFFDGVGYRLQIRGSDTGAANKITFTENGTNFDLNGTGTGAPNDPHGLTFQQANDAILTVDGFTVKRSSNQIADAIQGVTLNLKQKTTSANTVSVVSDPNAVSTKINAVVTAYNSLISSVHKASGYGSQAASNPMLAGDSALRGLTDRLASTIGAKYNTGNYTTLGSIGLALGRDGTLSFDQTKFSQALAANPSDVQNILSRQTGATTGGAMATLNDVIANYTTPGTGLLALRQTSLTTQASTIDDQATSEQTRLDQYQNQLQKQFTAMELSYSASQQLLQQVGRIG